jgi:hypothetical protein
MFFKKGLREPSLIRKLAMKNPRLLEEMFYIANRYVMAEEATLNTKEQKKESGHTDQPSSSKGHDKKRKMDRSINGLVAIRPGEFEGFLDCICIFHP